MTDANAAEQPQTLSACDYCGLPVRSHGTSTGETRYCCLGCQLAAAITAESSDADSNVNHAALRLGLAVFFTMNVMVFTMALWSWDTYSIAVSENAAILKDLLRFACLLFSTPVLLILGKPLAENVANQIGNRLITADCLLIVGVAAAFGYSVVSVLTGREHIYFEVACMILVAVTLGRWLEAEGKQRAMKSLQSLQNLLPESANVVGNDGSLTSLRLTDITVGKIIRVLPGERIPLDGTIQLGHSFVDQQLVTGESVAISRSEGDSVFGGTANLDGRIDIRVDAKADAGVIQRLVESVREAAGRTNRPQRLADRLATVFVPAVVAISIVVFFAHWQTTNLHDALMSSMAVALIACPCALAIATPLAIWAALGNAAKHGVVFRTSDDLTSLGEIDHICIDKTGTVTTSDPRLTGAWHDEQLPATSPDSIGVDITKQLTAQTHHPLSKSLLSELIKQSHDTVVESPFLMGPATTFPGRGVSAELQLVGQNTLAILGNRQFCKEQGLRFSNYLRQQTDTAIANGHSVVCVGWGSAVKSVYSFEESLRSDAIGVVKALQKLSLQTLLLTGDQTVRARRIGGELGLNVAAQLLPGDKQAAIERLQNAGHKVAMLGDGLNDAPALSVADVGIALGCGAEITRDAADVCLLSSDLSLLPWAIELSRATRRTIRRNLVWAVAYNGVGIALAAAGKLNPIFAALAMVLSSGFVITESLRLSARPGPMRVDKNALPNVNVENNNSPLLTPAPQPVLTIRASGT